MKFGFVAKYRGVWPVLWLCEALGGKRKPVPTVDVYRISDGPGGDGILAVPGQEFGDPGGEVPTRQLVDGVGEVGFGVEAV